MPLKALVSIYHYLARVCLFATFYVLAAEATRRFFLDDAPYVWAPSGIAVGALILLGARMWPGIAMGAFASSLLHDPSPVHAAAASGGCTLEALLAAYVLRRFAGFRPSMERTRDVAWFILLAGVLSPLASGPSCLAHALGILLVAPLLLTWIKATKPDLSPPRIFEALALSLLIVSSGLIVHCGLISDEFAEPLTFASFPLVIWAALRFGLQGASAALFIAAGFAAYGLATGAGPLDGTAFAVFVATLALVGLLTAAWIAESRHALQEKDKQQERLKRTLSNVLGGRLNICAKCKKIREGEDRWVPIEKYVGSRTSARFTHGICPECSEVLYPEFCEHS